MVTDGIETEVILRTWTGLDEGTKVKADFETMLDGTSDDGIELGTKVVTDGAITMVLLVCKV
jgi:hypothetical protein